MRQGGFSAFPLQMTVGAMSLHSRDNFFHLPYNRSLDCLGRLHPCLSRASVDQWVILAQSIRRSQSLGKGTTERTLNIISVGALISPPLIHSVRPSNVTETHYLIGPPYFRRVGTSGSTFNRWTSTKTAAVEVTEAFFRAREVVEWTRSFQTRMVFTSCSTFLKASSHGIRSWRSVDEAEGVDMAVLCFWSTLGEHHFTMLLVWWSLLIDRDAASGLQGAVVPIFDHFF